MEKKKVEWMICPKWKECANKGCVHRVPHFFDCCNEDCVWHHGFKNLGGCIPYELQVGDRVLVMESMRGVIEEKAWCSEMLEEVGSERVVRSVSGNLSYHEKCADLEGSYFSWPVDHLQYVGRGEKDITTTFVNCGVSSATGWPTPVDHGSPSPLVEPEYIATGKKLPLWELIKSSKIAMHELGNLVEWLTGRSADSRFMREDMFTINGFIDYALQYNCFKDFLINNGYIAAKEEERVEVFYKCGDRFEYEEYEAVIVVQKGSNKMAGLVLQGGFDKNVCWSTFVPVASLNKITQEEFEKMCGASPSSCWTKQ